jgi:hypothetical protein
MEVKCKFKQQNDVVERGTFKSRKVWVIDDENADYPQTLEVEVAQDKVNLFNNFRPGQPLTVSINLRGREWTNPQGEVKVFNTLQCWKVTSDVTNQQEEEATSATGDYFDAPTIKAVPKKKAGNIEKNFQNEFIQEITNDNNDLPF